MGLSGQAGIFFLLLLVGALLGILFDFYRVLRGVFRPRLAITSLADLLYWLIATVIVFGSLLAGNWGELRVYVFIGLLTGVIAYYRLFSRYTIHLLIRAIRLLVRMARVIRQVIGYFIVKPLAFSLKIIVSPFCFAKRKLVDKWGKPS